ncbi:alpha-L-arabinofuranosidase C-terminal domain-containing protein [Filimonas effusa]|uniref:non-reducing end alpha-L-arabinofuranosidase n=1 Tax=Filimonas effusa TaxID=2508721 RepID=A0A4Q1DDC1_9BACT|nr:alpha-L-arabinofuranosidase C-terminal domain-containing protein [Filimonas effusa]RXK86559.1 alpha-L-arabinofuranosidase [Filimonas effusa]
MKRITLFLCLFSFTGIAPVLAHANVPDSVYLFSYATVKNGGRTGLQFAWSPDKKSWFNIGENYAFVKSDYGRWGSEKRMNQPFLIQGAGGNWQCVWGLNEYEPVFAHVSSPDLVYWGRQDYPVQKGVANCLKPSIQYNAGTGSYVIVYTASSGNYYRVSTKDFKTYTSPEQVTAAAYISDEVTVSLPEGEMQGQVHRVAWNAVDKMIKHYEWQQYKRLQNAETTKQDEQRFAGIKPVAVDVTVHPGQAKAISDLLLGIFFEDINYAADGGLYAELVQNRDFEYALDDKQGHDTSWHAKHSWKLEGANAQFTIETAQPIHPNNPNYAVLDFGAAGARLINSGFDGITLKKGQPYRFSVFTRALQGKPGKLQVKLVGKDGKELAAGTLPAPGNSWKDQTIIITPVADVADAQLELQPSGSGRIAIDMVSLFPQNTFKGRKNGLRADLAQVIADIHPKFVRFPGGCVAHGDGLGNIYRWKNAIGPLEARKPQRNLWGYHQTAGLGYFEYFQFCEDIGAAPVPVIAAGVPCQNSGVGGGGQQGGIPMDEMDAYIQDILDLVEYANGDVKTTWGKKRAEAGHPAPFNLKYIGIGNEDLISDVFEERFTMIFNAIKAKHPEISVIGTAGPASEGTDYEEGWGIATKLQVPLIDEHYYQPPGWFINNQDYYDRYDRTKSKVYLGEYAAHLPGRPVNLETALSEALYLTSLERNGDVVSMASYAPLLAKEGRTQWNPNLIYFNNTTVKPTVGYEVQKLYGIHAGDEYFPSTIKLSNNQDAVRKRVAVSVVRDSHTQDIIIKMVNLLPVPVVPTVNLQGITGISASRTVLKGNPDDKQLKPETISCSVTQAFDGGLPPYSFTIVRVKTKE